MKKHIISLSLFAATLFCSQSLKAQGLAVNTTGVAANASAMLDVASTTQGVLVPRMDSAQRTQIASPATGLLVYQTDGVTPGFYYNSGSAGTPAWTSLSPSSSATTSSAGGYQMSESVDLNSTNATSYIGLFSSPYTAVSTTAFANAASPMACAGTIDTFYAYGVVKVTATSGGVANNVYTGTVYKNNVATGITCSLTALSSATVGQVFTAHDNTHSVSFVAGDLIAIRWDQSNGATGALLGTLQYSFHMH